MCRATWIIASLLLTGVAHAQAPRAGAPAPTDGTTRAAVELSTTGNLSRGLVYRDLITSRAVIQAWGGPWGAYFQPYWLYSRIGTPTGRATADNDVYVRVGVFRRITSTTFLYAVNVYEHSLRRKVEHRDFFGAGPGVDLLSGKDAALLASVGVFGEVTEFGGDRLRIGDEPGPATTEDREVVRWGLRLYGRYRIADGKLAFTHDAIALPAFRDPTRDYRLLVTGTLDAPIVKGFAMRAQAEAMRDGVIVEGTTRNALVVTFGVSYRGEWQRAPRRSSD